MEPYRRGPSTLRGKQKPAPVVLDHGSGKAAFLKFMSTAFGAAYLMPPAPGVAGTLVGAGLWYVLGLLQLNPFMHFLVLGAFIGMGIYIMGAAEPYWGSAEASIMCFDTMVGVMVAGAWFFPHSHPNWMNMAGVIVAIYYFLDLTQPFPISRAKEAVGGGAGYMADDLLAAVGTLLITWGGYNYFWKVQLGLT